MNADGSSGVAVSSTIGVRAGFLLPLALLMVGLGLVITGGRGRAHHHRRERQPAVGAPVSPVAAGRRCRSTRRPLRGAAADGCDGVGRRWSRTPGP